MRPALNPVRYILESSTETLYTGSSQNECLRIARELGFRVIPGKPQSADGLRQTVKVLGKEDQHYYFHKKK